MAFPFPSASAETDEVRVRFYNFADGIYYVSIVLSFFYPKGNHKVLKRTLSSYPKHRSIAV